MPSLEKIKEQLKHIKTSESWMGGLEIKQLPNILWDDENLEDMVSGSYDNGSGVLFATDKRLIFVYKGLLFGLRVEDFSYDKITSIEYKTGLFFGEIMIFVASNKARITQIDKKICTKFADKIRRKINIKNHNTLSSSDNTIKTNNLKLEDKYSRLEKLNDLRLAGALSEEEFLKEKTKLLS